MLQGGILQHLQQKGMSQKDTTAFWTTRSSLDIFINILYSILLYHIMLYHILLYQIILYHTIIYYTYWIYNE